MTAHISLSFELISLISWLIKNERSQINNLIKHAVEHGFAEELNNVQTVDQQNVNENLSHDVLDFLEFLEHSMIKNLETIHVDNKTKNAILPALQKLEAGNIDIKTVLVSLQQAKTRLSKKQNTKKVDEENDPSTILFEQLLKNWKPNNKETIN